MKITIREDMSNLFDMKKKLIHSTSDEAVEIVLKTIDKTYNFPNVSMATDFIKALTCCYNTGHSAGYNDGYLDS